MVKTKCWSCRSNSGEERISPGPAIHVGQYWVVEHAYPTGLAGWLVIVLRRHEEALHQLRSEEFIEFGLVLERTIHALRTVFSCDKEYVACYAELEHFRHVHFHVVPRAADLPEHLIGSKSFAFLKVSEAEAVSRAEISSVCEALRVAYCDQ